MSSSDTNSWDEFEKIWEDDRMDSEEDELYSQLRNIFGWESSGFAAQIADMFCLDKEFRKYVEDKRYEEVIECMEYDDIDIPDCAYSKFACKYSGIWQLFIENEDIDDYFEPDESRVCDILFETG